MQAVVPGVVSHRLTPAADVGRVNGADVADFAQADGLKKLERDGEAIQHYTAAERIPAALKEAALLGKARCLTAVGDNPSAIAAYQQYIKENPHTPTSTRLILKVAEIQAASGEPQAAVK